MLSSQTPGAEIKPLWFPVHGDSNRMNIRQPTAVGTVFRMTDVMTKLRYFPAQVTFHSW